MKRSLLSVVLLFSLLMSLLSSGCSFGGKTVFSCNPDNLTGIEQVKIGKGRLTMYFDKKFASVTEKTPYGAMNKFFTNGNADDFYVILITSGVPYYNYKIEKIYVDSENYTINFKFKDVNESVITGFIIMNNKPAFENYTVDFKNSSLSVLTSVEESTGFDRPLSGYYCKTMTTNSQTYDKDTDKWSEIKTDVSKAEMWS